MIIKKAEVDLRLRRIKVNSRHIDKKHVGYCTIDVLIGEPRSPRDDSVDSTRLLTINGQSVEGVNTDSVEGGRRRHLHDVDDIHEVIITNAHNRECKSITYCEAYWLQFRVARELLRALIGRRKVLAERGRRLLIHK